MPRLSSTPRSVNNGSIGRKTDWQAFYELRYKNINKLRETKNPNPYPHKFHVTQSIPAYIKEWGVEGKIEKGQSVEDAQPVR